MTRLAPSLLAVAALVSAGHASETAPPARNRSILLTFQGSPFFSPFADPFKVEEQIRFATGFRITNSPDFSTRGALHFFALPPSKWREFGHPAADDCKINVIDTAGPKVTLTFYRLDKERYDQAQTEVARAQACFVSGVFRHFGVANLPAPAKLAEDRDFLTIKDTWYTRLYDAVSARGDQ